jgi:hypothetical protein
MVKNNEILAMLDSNVNVEEFALFMKNFENKQLSQKLSSAIWQKMIYQSNPDINFIKNCGIKPDVYSHLVLKACKQSDFNQGSIHTELLEMAISLTPKRASVLKDLEQYATRYTGLTFLNSKVVDKLEPYYLTAKSQNPYKFRYLTLMYQLQFLELSHVKFSEMTNPFAESIMSNVHNLLVNSPQMLIKSKKIKDRDYQSYVDTLMLHYDLEEKIPPKPISKKIKI